MFGFDTLLLIALFPALVATLPAVKALCAHVPTVPPVVSDFDTWKHMKGHVIFDPTHKEG